jgi:uncharacterized DUF497 family protein
MRISNLLWLPQIIDKLDWKHHVTPEEVEEVLFEDDPLYRKMPKGHRLGEDVYVALGQTRTGWYLIIYFVYKSSKDTLIISARDMDNKERRR